MILIISNNENDVETDSVCKWLMNQKTDFLKLNLSDFF